MILSPAQADSLDQVLYHLWSAQSQIEVMSLSEHTSRHWWLWLQSDGSYVAWMLMGLFCFFYIVFAFVFSAEWDKRQTVEP